MQGAVRRQAKLLDLSKITATTIKEKIVGVDDASDLFKKVLVRKQDVKRRVPLNSKQERNHEQGHETI